MAGSYREGDAPRTILLKSLDGGLTWVPVEDPVGTGGGGGGLTDAQLRATPVPVSDGAGSLTVDGTFWQATQPVSGTFFQGTQPVSGPLTDAQLRAAVVPIGDGAGSITVDGTFWQATQPVSGPLTDAQLRAAVVPIGDGGGSVTVDGTFWQATQPVSGTFFQGTQPVSIAATVTVDTELPAAAALADAAANPTAPGVGAFGLVWNGATWDRSTGTAANGTKVEVTKVVKSATSTAAARTVTGAAASILASNTNRRRVMVTNTGTATVKLVLGTSNPTATVYHAVVPPCTVADDGTGGVWIDDMWTGQIMAFSASAGAVNVVELT